MAGYLGKISAIVSANTADFQSKLSAAAKDVQKFASSMQGALSSAQTKSATALRGIYTEAQKLDRALQAVSSRKLAFRGFQGKDLEDAVSRMKALYSTTQQISGPLSTSAKAFEKLSSEVQAKFLPALISAQKSTEALADTINKTGTVSEQRFDAVAKKVNLVREAIGRLTQASAAVSQLEGGAGLKFSSPRQFDAFAAAAAQQQRAAGLSGAAAARLGIGPQQQALSNQARAVEALMADRERLMARGQATGQVDAAIARETDRLEAQLRVYERLIDAAQKYDLVRRGGFVSAEAVVSAAKSSDSAKSAAQEEAMFRDRAAQAAQEEAMFLERAAEAAEQQAAARAKANQRRDSFGAGLEAAAPSSEALDMELARTNKLQKEFESLPPDMRKGLESEVAGLNNIAEAAKNGSASVGLLAANNDRLAESMRNVKSSIPLEELVASAQEVKDLETEMRKLKAAATFGNTFADFAQNSAIQAAVGKLQYLRSVLVASGVSSAEAEAALDSLAKTYREAAEAAGGFALNADKVNAAEEAAAAAVAPAAGTRTKDLISGMKRAGDVGRMGFDKFSLAANQAAFAIDDFLSSTGGVEFKLRAISNNITQLAFILGGTKGLFIGLGAVIGGQLAVGLMKWANSGRTAEDSTKALNDALARQKSLVEDLAQAFDSLGDSIGRKGFSAAGQKASEFEREIGRIEEKQKSLREEKVASLDPRVLEARASVNVAQKKVEQATTVGQSVLAQRELEEAKRKEREAVRAAVARPAPTAADAQREIVAVLEREARVQAAAAARNADNPAEKAAAVQRELAAGEERVRNVRVQGNAEDIKKALEQQIVGLIARGASDVEIARLQSLIESLQSPIQQLRDKALIQILRAADDLASSLEQSQVIINSAFGDSASAIREVLDRTTKRLQEVQKQAENSQNPEAFDADIAALEDHVNELKAAAMAVAAFSDEMRRASESFSADTASFQQMADEARREDLKKSTPETQQRRAQAEQEAKDARRAQREFEDRQATARERIERDMMVNGQPVSERMRQIDEQLAVAPGETNANGVRGGTVEEREALREERRRLQDQIDTQVAASPEVQAAKSDADKQTGILERRRRINQQIEDDRKAAERGKELGMSSAERARRDAREGANDLAQRAAEIGNDSERQAFLQQGARNLAEKAAPMLFDMEQQRQNALIAPSRAALNVSDVTSMEGQRELNRLLRGDDSAKDVNLAEMRKQTEELKAIREAILEQTGTVVDL
jgi:hypothetical protein